MELLPLGPVLFIDTAGIDDVGALGELRVAADAPGLRPRRTSASSSPRPARGATFEDELARRARGSASVPVIVVFNKIDLARARRRRSLRRLDGGEGPRRATVARRRRGRRWTCARPCSRRRPATSSTAAGDRRRPRAARRAGRAGRADRQGGAEGPADPAAGAGHPRPARRRRLLHWSSRSASCATRWTA